MDTKPRRSWQEAVGEAEEDVAMMDGGGQGPMPPQDALTQPGALQAAGRGYGCVITALVCLGQFLVPK